jgi:serine/threonine protein kinase
MKVYCTRPRQPDESPHWTSVDDTLLSNADTEWRELQNCECAICDMPLILGRGRYVPIAALGQGGFGYTFLAWDLKFSQAGTYTTRVIKQFRTDRLLVPGQIESALRSFEQEVHILNKLKHPQIPQVYEPFKAQTGAHTYAYFVQEHVPGQDLQVELADRQAHNRPWTEAAVRDLLAQLLDILNYIHTAFTAPIVHRDIKPSNIIHNDNGRYYLVDFGSVKQVVATLESGFSRPETQHVISAGYSPPEQHHGVVDCSSDLYALGKTCIYLLTDNQNAIAASPELMNVLQKMTESEPQKRYRSATEVLAQLVKKSVDRSPPKHLRQWVIGSGVALSLSLLGYVAYNRSKEPIPVRDYRRNPLNISSVTDIPSGEFKYGGSTTWTELSTRLNPIIQQTFPRFKLRSQAPPGDHFWHSEAGIDMLIQRQIDFALSSKGIPEEQLQKARSANIKLKAIPIAISSSAIIVHPDLPVDGITVAELDLIKKGKITNWKSLRGPDLPLKIYQKDAFYLSGADFVRVKNATESYQRIAADPGGVTTSPASLAASQCQIKALKIGGDFDHLVHPYEEPIVSKTDCLAGRKNKPNIKVIENISYPLRRELSVIVIEDGTRAQWAGETYAYTLKTTEAQNQIREAGYMPIVDAPLK